LVALADKSLR